MLARLRPLLTYANVVATLALFLALGGSAVATHRLINGRTLAPRSVPGTKIVANSLTRREVRESALGRVPNANRLDGIDSKQFVRTDRKAPDADKLDGLDNTDFLRPDSAGRAFDASRLEGLPGTSYRLTCPPSDRPARLFFSLCIESHDRSTAAFTAASTACAELGGRLPTIAELESFRQQGSIILGASAGGVVPEWSATPHDASHWWGLREDGTLVSIAVPAGQAPFRCVYTPSG
jgi:hypothetical protein